MHRPRSPFAFTLIELLTTVAIITVASATAWITVSVLTQSSETSRNRATAVNLLQKSLEEIRRFSRFSQNDYDRLSTCQFPADASSPNPCGLEPIADFPGFTRSMTVTDQFGSAELKKVEVTVTWSELGQARTMTSVAMLSRPPNPLPGNVIGVVRSNAGGNPLIPNATITLTLGAATFSTQSAGALSAKGVNFDFIDSSGKFMIPPGSWNLTATHNSYDNYTHPSPVVVDSNQEVRVLPDIIMNPKPQDATIFGRLVFVGSNNPIPGFNGGQINLLENGGLSQQTVNANAFSFTVPFNSPTQRCFTVNTTNAYRAGYAFRVNSLGAPSCSFDFQANGWSSAVMQGGTLVCSNPYNGGPALGGLDPDTICVNPGDRTSVNPELENVPTVTINGNVVDSNGNRVPNATVYAYWPRSAGSPFWGAVTANVTGDFSIQVPAAQSLFPDGSPSQFHVMIFAQGQVQVMTCCDAVSNVARQSNSVYIGPLKEGDPARNNVTLTIPIVNSLCGNLDGIITDASTGSGLNAALVQVAGANTNTAGSGQYQYVCPGTGYRLNSGSYIFRALKGNYYDFISSGNSWYQPQANAAVLVNQTKSYDAKLFPIGYGTITGTVRDAGTASPLANASVTLTLYNGAVMSTTTGASGTFQFNSVLETWPPSTLPPGDPYFRYGAIGHPGISVSHSSGFYDPASQGIPRLNRGETLNLDISLNPKGGM